MRTIRALLASELVQGGGRMVQWATEWGGGGLALAHGHDLIREERPEYGGGEADELLELGERIAELARRIQVAEHEMMRLIVEFDERRGWVTAGFGSCAEWLAWRLGSKLNCARERVRTAHALHNLPRTSAAMAAGSLSFSKVRALTRIATPDSEEALLEFAHAGSATHLERVVRAWKALDDRQELRLEQVRHRNRSLSIFVGDDGSYIVKGRLDPEVGALLMRAVDAESDAVCRGEVEGGRRGQAADRDGDAVTTVTPAQRRADAVGLLAERALHAGFGGAASGSRAERYQVMLHVEPDTLRADRESRRSEVDGARVCGETSRRMTCDASVVQVVEATEGLPVSDSSRALDVTAVTSGTPRESAVLGVGRRTRTIPPALRRALLARDRGCRFPGCGCRFTDAHHVTHWADGGHTDLNNLVLLCPRHHRAVHEGGMRVCLDIDGKVAFFTPSGRAVFDAPRGGMAPGETRRPEGPVATLGRSFAAATRSGATRPGAARIEATRMGASGIGTTNTTATETAGVHASIAPLPPAPPSTAAYPGADRWRRDREIPWAIEASAREAWDGP